MRRHTRGGTEPRQRPALVARWAALVGVIITMAWLCVRTEAGTARRSQVVVRTRATSATAIAASRTAPPSHLATPPVMRLHGATGPVAPAAPVASASPLPGLAGSANLAYQGGYVMHTTDTFVIYWHPTGTTPLEPTYRPLVERYLGDVGSSDSYDLLTQYSDSGNGAIANTSALAATFDDQTTPYPHAGTQANPLTDLDIATEVDHAIAVSGGQWGSSQALSTLTNLFVVLLPKGVYLSAGGGLSFVTFCAYHSAFYDNTDTSHIRVYAAMPYAGTSSACTIPSSVTATTPNNDPDADSEINLLSHELYEAASDPYPAGPGYAGWYNGDTAHEIGDQCNFVFPTVAADHSDVHLGGHPYLVQAMWSNADSAGSAGCVVSYPDNFLVSAPATAAAGRPFTFTVSARSHDALVARGYTGTVHFTSTDPTATLPADSTLTGGMATFSATLHSNASISVVDTSLATLSGSSGTVVTQLAIQVAGGGVFHAGSVAVTLGVNPTIGDTLVMAVMSDVTATGPLGWPAIATTGIGRGDASSVLTLFEHRVVTGDGRTWAAALTTPGNTTAAVYEIPSSSGSVENTATLGGLSVFPEELSVTATAGDYVLGIYADNSVHGELATVTGEAGVVNAEVIDAQGVGTGTPHALGAFDGSLTAASGGFSVGSAQPANADAVIVLAAFRP